MAYFPRLVPNVLFDEVPRAPQFVKIQTVTINTRKAVRSRP